MTNEETLQYIHSLHGNKGTGLDHTRAMLTEIGNPQLSLSCIHVAGTNGKGSVCAMLDSILRCAGYRVGLYTSPFVKEFYERIRVNGENIPAEELSEIADFVRSRTEKLDTPPTEFEFITVVAFEYFKRQNVDVVVLEVGLGGRLDPTNVIENPLLSVITGIGFDHMALLGNTLQAIAAEKAGIIKPHKPSLFGGGSDSAGRVLATVANAKKSEFRMVDRSRLHIEKADLNGTDFGWGELGNLHINLLGIYQPHNAATVLTAVEILREKSDLKISDEAIREGLEKAVWHARFEKLSESPLVFFDGAHNPQGIHAAVRSIETYFPNEKVLILSGVMVDKDYDGMVEGLKSVTEKAYTVTPENPRALKATEYAESFNLHGVRSEAFETAENALRTAMKDAKEQNKPLVCVGSLYLYKTISDLAETMQF